MSNKSEEYQIIGARGLIESKEDFFKGVRDFVTDLPNGMETLIQFLNADLVCGKLHLQAAIEHAQRAFLRGNAISDSLAMEMLIYASGEVQISSALAKMGLRDGSENVACVIGTGIDIDSLLAVFGLTQDDDVLDCTEEKLFRFGISKESISAAGSDTMTDLVLEKVSMVDVRK